MKETENVREWHKRTSEVKQRPDHHTFQYHPKEFRPMKVKYFKKQKINTKIFILGTSVYNE
jgi:hypothetical protein